MHFNTILRHILAVLLGYACTAIIYSISTAETPVLQVLTTETVRGVITLTLGALASLGIAAAQAAQSADCLGLAGAVGRFALLLFPNLLLGLFWQRYRLRGGFAALVLSGLWQLAIQKPDFWPLPAVVFIAAATFLLSPIFFQKPVSHATEIQSS